MVWFLKNKYNDAQALGNSNREVNIITPTYIFKLGLAIRQTNVET